MRQAPTYLLAAAFTAFLSGPLPAQLWEVHNQLFTAAAGAVSGQNFGQAFAVGDFDGDGYDDLAIGSDDIPSVEVHRGGPAGLATLPWTTLTDTDPGSGFGTVLAAGDFDHDGRDELAVGAPYRGAGLTADAGAVLTFELQSGSWVPGPTFTQASPGVPGDAESGDGFGTALAVGDFDGDSFADLAIGVPFEAIGSTLEAGAVNVLYGGAGGLSSAGAQLWCRSGGGIDGAAAYAFLGFALAAGDFDADGYDDLAIGAPTSWASQYSSSGEVVVLYGGSGPGLVTAGQQRFDPSDFGALPDFQSFGSTLAAADYDRNGICDFYHSCAADLAIGAPDESVSAGGGAVSGAGKVYVLLGSKSYGGLDPSTAYGIDQSTLIGTFGSAPEPGDHFGEALAAGELDGLRGTDLAVGTPSEQFDGIGPTGCADALFGGAARLDGRVEEFLYSRSGFASAPQHANDRFAAALAIGDFDGNGAGDLAVGLVQRAVDGHPNAGAVQILYGALFADGFESGGGSGWLSF